MTHHQKRLKDVAARLSKRFFVPEELRTKLIEFQERANRDGKFDFEVLFDFKNKRILDIREAKYFVRKFDRVIMCLFAKQSPCESET